MNTSETHKITQEEALAHKSEIYFEGEHYEVYADWDVKKCYYDHDGYNIECKEIISIHRDDGKKITNKELTQKIKSAILADQGCINQIIESNLKDD